MSRQREDERVRQLRDYANLYGTHGPSPTGEYRLCCPWCGERVGKPDVHYKLRANQHAFNKKTKTWGSWYYCYRCEAKGGGIDLSWLGPVATPGDPTLPKECDSPPEGFNELDVDSMVHQPYVHYLGDRSVLDQAIAVGVGVCTSGKYAGRVVIPMKDAKGNWRGFSARTAVDRKIRGHIQKPKYLYPAGMDRRGSLWGSTWVPRLKDREHPLYLVEGVFDALPLYPYGLAAFGKAVTDDQLDLLASMVGTNLDPVAGETQRALGGPRSVVVCLDGDAWRDAQAICGRLHLRGVRADYARLPPATDPGTLGWQVRQYIVDDPTHA